MRSILKPALKPAILFAVAAMAALGMSASVRAADPLVIRIGNAGVGVGDRPFIGGSPAATAHTEKYIEREFADTPGVTVDFKLVKGSGPAVNEALAARQLDFAIQGDLPSIVGRASGLKTRIVAASGVRGNIYLVARLDSGIDRLEDIRGKKVAQFRGTNSHLAVAKAVASRGLADQDVKFINMDHATAPAAVATGTVDAVFGKVDYVSLAEQGLAKIVYDSKADPTFTSNAHLLVSEEFEARHPDIVARVVKAFVRAAHWSSEEANRDRLFALWAQSGTPVRIYEADFAGQSLKYRNTPLIDDFLTAAYREQAKQAKALGLIRAEVDTTTWFEPKYVNQAVADLGLVDYWPRYGADGRALSN